MVCRPTQGQRQTAFREDGLPGSSIPGTNQGGGPTGSSSQPSRPGTALDPGSSPGKESPSLSQGLHPREPPGAHRGGRVSPSPLPTRADPEKPMERILGGRQDKGKSNTKFCLSWCGPLAPPVRVGICLTQSLELPAGGQAARSTGWERSVSLPSDTSHIAPERAAFRPAPRRSRISHCGHRGPLVQGAPSWLLPGVRPPDQGSSVKSGRSTRASWGRMLLCLEHVYGCALTSHKQGSPASVRVGLPGSKPQSGSNPFPSS